MKYISMVRKIAAIAATTVIALLMVLLRLLLMLLPLLLLLSLVLLPLLLSLTYRTNSQFNVFLIKYFKLNNPNRNISTNYVNNNIQTPRHNLDQEQKIIPNQHNKQKGQEDSTVSFSPTCDQPSLPHH